jgi:hypothetical protein
MSRAKLISADGLRDEDVPFNGREEGPLVERQLRRASGQHRWAQRVGVDQRRADGGWSS